MTDKPKPVPTVQELKNELTAIARVLRADHGERASVIIMIGVPNGAHDRFAATIAGPCLMTRGLLVWGERSVTAQIDAGDTSIAVAPEAARCKIIWREGLLNRGDRPSGRCKLPDNHDGEPHWIEGHAKPLDADEMARGHSLEGNPLSKGASR